MPFPTRAQTEERLTLCQDEERLSGQIQITNLPDPGALARFPHELAGSPQHGSLGHGQGLSVASSPHQPALKTLLRSQRRQSEEDLKHYN